jgi:glutathione S-transferase
MPRLELTTLSLRYSSWSMRPWLALTHAGAEFTTRCSEVPDFEHTTLAERRALGSVSGLFPVLRVDGTAIHETLAIGEYVAETFPEAGLWPGERLTRAQARAIVAEMVSNFSGMRGEMSCHLFARVPAFRLSERAARDVARVREIWTECLERSGGPFLFGNVTLADFFYFPVLTRFRTYGVALEGRLAEYARALDALPAVRALIDRARGDPPIAVYDHYVRKFGGDPVAAL